MARQEHIWIITAGENIQAAYTRAIRDTPDLSHTFVFADSGIYTESGRDDKEMKAFKTSTRASVNKVKEIAASLAIPAFLFHVNPPARESAEKLVLKIVKDHPSAKYSFDLTAGSKELSIALLLMSLWLEGDAYFRFQSQNGVAEAENLPIPKIPLKEVRANPNYMRVLSVLRDKQGDPGAVPHVLPRSYLFTQLETYYVPVRKKGVKTETHPTKTDLFTGTKAVIPQLSQGTFANILSTMEAKGLICSGQCAGKKESCATG